MFGFWPDFYHYEIAFSHYMAKRGHTVDIIVSDGILPLCDNHLRWLRHEQSIQDINKGLKASYDKVCSETESTKNINTYKLSNYIKQEDLHKTYTYTPEKANFLGFTFDSLATDLLCSPMCLQRTESEQLIYLRDTLFKSSILVYKGLEYIYNSIRDKWDLGFVTHAHRTLISTFDKCLERKGIPSLCYMGIAHKCFESSFIINSRDECFPIRMNIEHPKLIPKNKLSRMVCKDFLSKTSLNAIFHRTLAASSNEEVKLNAIADFSDPVLSKRDEYKPNHSKKSDLQSYLKRLIPDYKEVIVNFTSTESEERSTISDYRESCLFCLLKHIVQAAKSNPDKLFLIRDHPNKYISEISRYALEPENSIFMDKIIFEEEFELSKIKNLIYIDPWDKVDSHWLLWNSSIAISAHSEISADAFLAGCFTVTSAYNIANEVCDLILYENELRSNKVNIFEKIFTYYSNWKEKYGFNKKIFDGLMISKERISSLYEYQKCVSAWISFNRYNFKFEGVSNIELGEAIENYVLLAKEQTFSESIYNLIPDQIKNNNLKNKQVMSGKDMELINLMGKAYQERKLKSEKKYINASTKEKDITYILGLEGYLSTKFESNKKILDNMAIAGETLSLAINSARRVSNIQPGKMPIEAITSNQKNIISYDIPLVSKDGIILPFNIYNKSIESLHETIHRNTKYYELHAWYLIYFLSYWKKSETNEIKELIQSGTLDKVREYIIRNTHYIARPVHVLRTTYHTNLYPRNIIS